MSRYRASFPPQTLPGRRSCSPPPCPDPLPGPISPSRPWTSPWPLIRYPSPASLPWTSTGSRAAFLRRRRQQRADRPHLVIHAGDVQGGFGRSRAVAGRPSLLGTAQRRPFPPLFSLHSTSQRLHQRAEEPRHREPHRATRGSSPPLTPGPQLRGEHCPPSLMLAAPSTIDGNSIHLDPHI